jgi:enterochelin esterase-like enzyme
MMPPVTPEKRNLIMLGPLEPNIYDYGFLVDGVRASDPSCRGCNFTWAGRGASTRLLIPGDPPRSWEPKAGSPPGALHHERFFSKRQQAIRRFVVYTPPGYGASASQRYPALILLPGTPGDENDWTSGGGFVDIMFDNLIAAGRMTPMIVVMHASDVLDPPDNRRGDENLHAFETIVVNELVPIVKQRYRVRTDPQFWALAGLSLGGEFGMYVGLRHPELFGTIASISGSLVPSSFDARFPLSNRPSTSKADRLIWIGAGAQDIFFGGAKEFSARLQAAGLPHVFREFDGAHVMPVFRRQIEDLLPRLFRK